MAPKKQKSLPVRLFRRGLPHLVVLVCIAALAFAGYVLYLDKLVRDRFEGSRWTLPAQVYARPMELYPGLQFPLPDLKRELQRLGYRERDSIDVSGSYRVKPNGMDLNLRSFHFWDGEQPGRSAHLKIEGGVIQSITDMETGEQIQLMRMDPLLIGSIYPVQGEDRILVRLEDIPNTIPAGIIVVEDRQFLDHMGVSPKAIARAFWANMRAGAVVQGGSTITQQLVKNFFLDNRQTLGRKINEAIMAVLLEVHYGKREILQAYLNEIYLGQDGSRAIHGFGLASLFYFNKPLAELDTHEFALLIALVKGPSYFDPRRHPERALRRRNLVIDMFASADFITDKTALEAKNEPLGVVEKKVSSTTRYPAFVDLVRRQLRGQYRETDLTDEGLRIFTTLDPHAQEVAEKQLSQGLPRLEGQRGLSAGVLQGAVVVTTVETGEVLAVVGGREVDYAGFNRALDARRPIGSLVKPMVYLTALSQPERFNLVTFLNDEPLTVRQPSGKIWAPKNYDHQNHGDEVPLWYALARSYNIATARLGMAAGIPKVAETIKKLGFQRHVPSVPALTLGVVEMAPLEVAQVYNTLSSGGFYSPLLSIREVTTQEGEPLIRYEWQLRKAYDEGPVYLVNWILKRVVAEGTAASAYNVLSKNLGLAGKTGTTDDLRDSWFAGYGGDKLSVVWVGRDDNKPTRLSGATGALRIWRQVMKDINVAPFKPAVPPEIEFMSLDPYGDEHDDEDCDRRSQVPFIKGYIPYEFEPCDEGVHVGEPPERERRWNWFLDLFR